VQSILGHPVAALVIVLGLCSFLEMHNFLCSLQVYQIRFVSLGPLNCAKRRLHVCFIVTRWSVLVGVKHDLDDQLASFSALTLLVRIRNRLQNDL